MYHQGRGQTLNHARSRGYWILPGRKVVEKFLKSCAICRKLHRQAEQQKMADLPEERVEPSPSFSFVGMDCFGSFTTKGGSKEHKHYGLFTCLCSRAVHSDMLHDMTTDALILGMRWFIAIRGTVSCIRCAQGSNFVGANNEFKAVLKELDKARIIVFLAKKQCEFIFNASHSSHA